MNALVFEKKKASITSKLHTGNRSCSAFLTRKDERIYWIVLATLIVLGLLSAYGLLVYNNPVPRSSPSFVPVVRRRINAVITMLLVATCQSLATVTFQSITNNRIITPSLLGFEALYSAIQTATMFFFGLNAFLKFTGIGAFVVQVAAMVLISLILYGLLLSSKYGDLQLMLLIGVIIGTGLRSLSSFMRRLLAPSEFDILQARLFGSVNNADPSYFPFVIPVVIITAIALFMYSRKLNILSLGRDVATSLGVRYTSGIIFGLILVSILMSMSTAMVGSLTFYGFLVASLTYQLVPTYDHRFIFPVATALGFLVLTASYFFMYHIFNAQGVVSIIIEMFGGLIFLIVLLKKGAL